MLQAWILTLRTKFKMLLGESLSQTTRQLQSIAVADYVANIAAVMIDSIFGMQIFNFKSV